MKGIIVFSLSFLLFCSISIARAAEVTDPVPPPRAGGAIPARGPIPQQRQAQPVPVPQQTQSQTATPQTSPAAPVPARTEEAVGPSETNGGPGSPQASVAPVRPATRANGMISLNFDDADVYSVAQTVFGEILRVNYIIDQRIKGRVTFRSVAPVATDKVLSVMEVILRLNGIGVVEESGLYRLVPISDIAKEPAQVSIGRDPDKITLQGKSIIQVVPLSYGNSTEMIKLVSPFLTTSAVVIDVPTLNHIILVDTDANVKRILNIVRLFDSEETKARKPQVYVYHVQNSKAKDIATILQQAFSTTTVVMPATTSSTTVTTASSSTSPATPQAQQARPAATPTGASPVTTPGTGASLVSPLTKIIADENMNLLLVLSLPEDYEIIKEAIHKVDIIPRQVVVEGIVAEVNMVDDFSLGISWALQLHKGGMGGILGGVEGLVGFNMPGASVSSPVSITDVDSGKFSFAGTVGGDLKAIINTLATQSKAKLLAAPRILVSDNKEASINVGEQVPIVTSSTTTTATTTPTTTSTIQYKDVGIILKVKPRINEGGLVSLELTQEISSYSVQEIAASGSTSEKGIVVSKTEAKTNLVVQNGNTIMIGGLIREDTSDGRSGIPLLSRIPVLGYLFGQTDKTNHRKELIILLTPRVVTNESEARAVTSDYVSTITATGKGELKKEELLRDQKAKTPDKANPENTSTPSNGNKNGGEDKKP